MHRIPRIVAAIVLLAIAVGGWVAAPRGTLAASEVVGHVYVNDNTAGTNTIAAFDQHQNGRLTPMLSPLFSAGGAGTGTAIGSQGALQISSDGDYLLAVDAGSNQISVLHIGDAGRLQLVGSPISSNGIQPVSIGVHRDLVYVANAGNGTSGSNYTGFRFNSGGELHPLSGSTVLLKSTALPGDVLFNATGTHLIGTEIGTSLVDSFTVGDNGRLAAAPGSPFAAQAAGPFGSEFRPANPSQLYVSNAHAGANLGSISAYNVTARGVLDPIGASPYLNKQTASCWVEITHDGRYLFTVDTASSAISRYRIGEDGGLSLLGSTVFNDPTGLGPFDARLDPAGRNLYVVDNGLDMVSGFAVDEGTLTELPSSPFALPAHATPFGIVVTQSD
ncbi:MAG: lactonase family protein [Chloroflexota bacterium]|nr:MAG: hypothetical protein DLM70_12940 [Chloroflexota bacterium]